MTTISEDVRPAFSGRDLAKVRGGFLSGLVAAGRVDEKASDAYRARFKAYGRRHISRIRQLETLSPGQLTALKVASVVLPFRVNDYVL